MNGNQIIQQYEEDMRSLVATIPQNPDIAFWTNFNAQAKALSESFSADIKTATWN